MLALSVVEEIGRLLGEGNLSQRKIAARLGVSRGTVGAIASGRRGMYGKESRADDPEPLACQSPPQRCRRCGYLVHTPCLVCRTRQYRDRQRRLKTMVSRPAVVGPRAGHGLPIHPPQRVAAATCGRRVDAASRHRLPHRARVA